MKDQAQGLRQWAGERHVTRPLKVMALASGKGGVGKTNLAANLAYAAVRSGRRTLVLDADLGLANVELLLGLRPRYHLGHLLEGAVEVREVLARSSHGVDVLPAGSGVQALTRLSDEQKRRLTLALDTLEDAYELVLIDSSAGIGDNVLFFAGAAQQVLLVVSPEPTSLTDAYATVKVLSQQAGVTDFEVVANNAPSEAHGKDVFLRLTGVTSRFLTARLRYAGHVPPDDAVHRAVMAGRPVCELFPHAPAARAMAALAERLLEAPGGEPVSGGLKFLWHRLFRESAPQAEG